VHRRWRDQVGATPPATSQACFARRPPAQKGVSWFASAMEVAIAASQNFNHRPRNTRKMQRRILFPFLLFRVFRVFRGLFFAVYGAPWSNATLSRNHGPTAPCSMPNVSQLGVFKLPAAQYDDRRQPRVAISLLREACHVFAQKCIYLSVAGQVEFVGKARSCRSSRPFRACHPPEGAQQDSPGQAFAASTALGSREHVQ
jgi:hypothetical protein